MEILLNKGKELFENEFSAKPELAVFAPGRVNLIGEHTDYNDGFVLPMALPLVTIIVGRKILGDLSTIVTNTDDADDPKKVEIPLNIEDIQPGEPKWANYVKGVIVNFVGNRSAFEAVIVSNVPIGGGLSSSASLEVATYTFLESLNPEKDTIKDTDKALACQKAEHEYAGMPCGIMDQFISVMGKKDNALLIDCRDLTSELVPLLSEEIVILITNSNVKHELTGSEYSSRRTQCETAARLLNIPSLRQASSADIKYLEKIGADKEVIQRARHVITEISRTSKAAEALKLNDFVTFGQLMVESHASLRDDFQVSCPELDELVNLSVSVEGVLGSRMTGGGFGGCTVTMVHKHAVDSVQDHITTNYKKSATFYVCKPCDGTGVLSL